MPSPRSVLHDITVLGLDPTVAHKQVSASGHLKTKAVKVEDSEKAAKPAEKAEKAEKPVAEKKAEKKKPEPKPGLVKLHCEECNKDNDCGCACDKCQPKSVAKKDAESAS